MSNGPIEPRAEIRSGAAELFQFFVALTNQGFNEHQALTLIGKMLIAGQTGGDA